MIIIEEPLIELIKKRPGIIEISGLPDSGVTSGGIKLIQKVIDKEEMCAGAIFSSTNYPNMEYLTRLIPSHLTDKFIVLSYEPSKTDIFIPTIEKFGSDISYWLIDDFYHFLLYRNYTFIRDFMKGLELLSRRLCITIFIVNQYRYIIPAKNYEFVGDSHMKSLYIEHIRPFLSMRLRVEKDENKNIYLSLIEKQEKKSPDSFLGLLNSLE